VDRHLAAVSATVSRQFVLNLSGAARSVFISYNHGSKSAVLKVRDRLLAVGVIVWIDEDDMCMSAQFSSPSSSSSSSLFIKS